MLPEKEREEQPPQAAASSSTDLSPRLAHIGRLYERQQELIRRGVPQSYIARLGYDARLSQLQRRISWIESMTDDEYACLTGLTTTSTPSTETSP